MVAKRKNNAVRILEKVEKMKLKDQVLIMEGVATLVGLSIAKSGVKHSVMELEGLGKPVWKRVAVEEYLSQERDSWT